MFFKSSLSENMSRLLFFLSVLSSTRAFELDPVEQPPLQLSNLGQVGIAGDFDAISIYSYKDQNERSLLPSGSHSIYGRLPDGGFAPLVSSDAAIQAICPYKLPNGTTIAVVGGNFTSLGSAKARGIALFDPETRIVTPIPGLEGKVNALHCNQDEVFVGGEFSSNFSSHAMTWKFGLGWEELPFDGFNGPVHSIIQDGDSIIFGGEFDGLGNSSSATRNHQQTINLQTAVILADQTNFGRPGFDDPRNIICSDGSDAPGKTWLMNDGQVGSWRADFGYMFKPTKIRLFNTHIEGRGVREWRFTAFPINGILNLTYTDPDGNKKYCESRCPLSDDPSVEFQDFEFVNVISMNSFRIDISGFYGAGGGLAGIQVFSDDILSYAINDNNEPACALGALPSRAEVEGNWFTWTSPAADSNYLRADIGADQIGSTSVTFQPDIQSAGRYRIAVYTPGCRDDGTCSGRGRVVLTGKVKKDEELEPTLIFQTNDYSKYDTIYEGEVDMPEGDFRPSITLRPSTNQGGANFVTVVAQKVLFEQLTNTSSGLNGIYEYKQGEENFSDFSESVITSSGDKLEENAKVFNVLQVENRLFVGGSFESDEKLNNIYEIRDNQARALANDGLNGAVSIMAALNNKLYVAGNFTGTKSGNVNGISYVAAYDLGGNRWEALGQGLNGKVHEMIPIRLNVGDNEEDVIVFSGAFSEIRNVGKADGIAVWVPSKNQWLQETGDAAFSPSGSLNVISPYRVGQELYAGSIASSAVLSGGAVTLTKEKQLTLRPLPLERIATPDSLQKRDVLERNPSGIVTGLFHVRENPKRNMTIVAGHFSAEGEEDREINNLAIIDRESDSRISGINGELNDTSTFYSLHIPKDTDILFAGGSLQGKIGDTEVGGLILWDLSTQRFAETQPASLQGPNPVVRTISSQPNSQKIFVGGSFDEAGSLNCPALCIYDREAQQWNRPASGISGRVNTMKWIDNDVVLVAGNMTANNTETYLALYDAKNSVWRPFPGGNEEIPGPVKSIAFDSTKGETVFIAGKDSTEKSFLKKWDGKAWKNLGYGLQDRSVIHHIQVLKLEESHDTNDLLKDDHVLLVTGSLTLEGAGSCSAALFDGKEWTPFLLSAKATGNTGSVSTLFSENEESFKDREGTLARGFVILISLAIALALVFLIVLLGILLSYIRRRREGYQPMPTKPGLEKSKLQERVPPQSLFGSIGPGGVRSEHML